jgi:hypothetical protein
MYNLSLRYSIYMYSGICTVSVDINAVYKIYISYYYWDPFSTDMTSASNLLNIAADITHNKLIMVIGFVSSDCMCSKSRECPIEDSGAE